MREKLIDLLKKTPITDINGHIGLAEVCFMPHVFEKMARHLIANGVTILTETKCNTINVKLPKEIVVHPYGGKWIPVSERLPEHFGTFLVAIDEVHGENRVSVDSADFDPYEKSWKTFNYFCAGFKITHWMPLPEPPNT